MSKLEEGKGFLLSLIRSRYFKDKEEKQELDEEDKTKGSVLGNIEKSTEKTYNVQEIRVFEIEDKDKKNRRDKKDREEVSELRVKFFPTGLVQREFVNSINVEDVNLENLKHKEGQAVLEIKEEQTYSCPSEKLKKKRGRRKVKGLKSDQESELVRNQEYLNRVGDLESEKEKKPKKRGRKKKIESLSLEEEGNLNIKASQRELEQGEIGQGDTAEVCFEANQGDIVDIFDVRDSIYQDSYDEIFNDSNTVDQHSEHRILSLSELEARAYSLNSEIVSIIYAIIENKDLNLGQRNFLIKKLTRNLIESFKDKKGAYIYVTALFDQFYGKQVSKISNYMYKLYLSKDYEHFRKLRPIDVVRYVRFYFGKSKHYIPFRFVPYLIKEARRIKISIYNRIQYYIKKEGYFIDKAQAFEMIKEKSGAKIKK